MAEIRVEPLAAAKIEAAAQLLASSFLDDQGMVVLFPKQTPDQLKNAMQSWFVATLNLWEAQGQTMLAAYDGDQLVGVLLGGHSALKVIGLAQLKWSLTVGWRCGFGAVVRTAQHDQERQKQFISFSAHIVEFVAVDVAQRGRGVGRDLFVAYHQMIGEGASIWLETTRQENLSIFTKLGYRERSRSISLGAKFVQMVRPPQRKDCIASS